MEGYVAGRKWEAEGEFISLLKRQLIVCLDILDIEVEVTVGDADRHVAFVCQEKLFFFIN